MTSQQALILAVSRDMRTGDLPQQTLPRIVHEWDYSEGKWRAFYDGCEGPEGWGDTTQEADEDLESNFGDGDEEYDWSR